MCGVFGAFNVPAAAEVIAYGLHGLQHRGGDGAGIYVYDGETGLLHSDFGSVSSIFLESKEPLQSLQGTNGVGHTRYATVSNTTGKTNLQPIRFEVDNTFIAFAHNGNFPDYQEVKKKHLQGTPFVSRTDSEVFFRLVLRQTRMRFSLPAIAEILNIMQGSCSAVMSRPDRLIAIRDPSGCRPLYWGKKGDGYVVASEPSSLDAVDVFEYEEVPPGCIMAFTNDGVEQFQMPRLANLKQCTFELVYFAFPAGEIFGVNVADFRMDLGTMLADIFTPDVDLVIGAPSSAIEIARGFTQARADCTHAQECLYRRHDVRSYIQPSQKAMLSALSRKFALWGKKIKDKRILIIDDSIVRGNTSRWLVEAFKKRGAKEVHFVSACPPIVAYCTYGIYMKREDLIADGRDETEIAKLISADSVTYPPMELFQSVFKKHGFLPENGCFTCMTGEYWH